MPLRAVDEVGTHCIGRRRGWCTLRYIPMSVDQDHEHWHTHAIHPPPQSSAVWPVSHHSNASISSSRRTYLFPTTTTTTQQSNRLCDCSSFATAKTRGGAGLVSCQIIRQESHCSEKSRCSLRVCDFCCHVHYTDRELT
jgi:hypothetical protein